MPFSDHIINYYVYLAAKAATKAHRPNRRPQPANDFDIETEQREGWAYGQ